MRLFKAALGLCGAMALSACVMSNHQENPALRMVRPAAQTQALADYTRPNPDYPTVGGNILKDQDADFHDAPAQPIH